MICLMIKTVKYFAPKMSEVTKVSARLVQDESYPKHPHFIVNINITSPAEIALRVLSVPPFSGNELIFSLFFNAID